VARPVNRRTGHSKKAQYSAFTGYLVAAFGALAGAVFLIVSLWRPDTFAPLRAEATDIAAPVGKAGAAGRAGGIGLIDTVTAYFRAGSQNARLRQQAQLAHVQLAETDALREENRELKALLKLDDEPVKPVAFARLVGSTSASTRRIAYLSAGRNQGVQQGMPVRAPNGLVGRVLEVGGSSARVLLLTDGASIVPVRRSTDQVVALAEGRADGTLRLRLINLGINPLKRGDVFVTSGAGGIYRPGVAVAIVSELTRDGAIGRVLANPAATIYVAVDPPWAPAPEGDTTGEAEAGQSG
jgi:rod shape-determining protein MreC